MVGRGDGSIRRYLLLDRLGEHTAIIASATLSFLRRARAQPLYLSPRPPFSSAAMMPRDRNGEMETGEWSCRTAAGGCARTSDSRQARQYARMHNAKHNRVVYL